MTRRGVVVFAFAVAVMAIAGAAFVHKMADFAMTIVNDEVQGFGAVAVATYLIGFLPLLFFTLWGVVSGRFRDIEAPKYRLFELDREIERGGELGPGGRRG